MRDAGAQVRPDHATARRSEGDAPSRCLGNGRKRSISAAPLQNTRQTDLVGSLGLKSDRLLDTMIAAHALSQHALLVTNNTREFAKVPGLLLDNWVDAD